MSLFGQGFNSVAHTVIGFGAGAANLKLLAGVFVFYEVIEHMVVGEEDNIMIDLSEFLIGLLIGRLINMFGYVN